VQETAVDSTEWSISLCAPVRTTTVRSGRWFNVPVHTHALGRARVTTFLTSCAVNGELFGRSVFHRSTRISDSPCRKIKSKSFAIWGSHDGENVDVFLVGCNVVWTCKQILTFRRTIMCPSSGLLRNVGIYLQVHTVLQTRRTTSTKGQVVTGV
jgi:hypothetical protein